MLKNSTRKVLPIILCIAMVFSLMCPAALAVSEFSDVDGHWAKQEILKWSDSGLIKGSEGLFRPDD